MRIDSEALKYISKHNININHFTSKSVITKLISIKLIISIINSIKALPNIKPSPYRNKWGHTCIKLFPFAIGYSVDNVGKKKCLSLLAIFLNCL